MQTGQVTRQEVLGGREVEYPLSPQLEANLTKLLRGLNKLRVAWGKPLRVSSGYRPGRFNIAAGGARNSAHLTCEACDFSDPVGNLTHFLLDNPVVLEECGLWLENPARTPGWAHLDIRPRNSRVFNP